tara:strand:+ start:3633 stop:4010 length:378 start_codon:yes stop_codon:yes gene_type:complete
MSYNNTHNDINTYNDIIYTVNNIYGDTSVDNILNAMQSLILDSNTSKILYKYLKNITSDSNILLKAKSILNKRGFTLDKQHFFTPCPAPIAVGCLHPSPPPPCPSPTPRPAPCPAPCYESLPNNL